MLQQPAFPAYQDLLEGRYDINMVTDSSSAQPESVPFDQAAYLPSIQPQAEVVPASQFDAFGWPAGESMAVGEQGEQTGFGMYNPLNG